MITSLSNAKVKQVVQWQNKAKERRKAEIFLAEGYKMYAEAPLSWIKEVFLSENSLEHVKSEPFLWKKLNDSGYEMVSQEVFSRMSDTRTPQGILAVLQQPKYSFEEILTRDTPLLILLEDLQDPGNLGTIVRTGEGAGVTGIIMTEDTVDIFNPKTIRATMGSIYRVPFVYVKELRTVLKELHAQNIRTYAAHLIGNADYDTFSYQYPTAFLIGNEGNGLQEETARQATTYLRIPMEGQVESLNAAIAASLLSYEAYRQRRTNKKK